jgi:hypothetical protein
MVNKITHFSDIAMKISENQYAQTLLMSQLKSNFLVDSLNVGVISEGIQIWFKPHTKLLPSIF